LSLALRSTSIDMSSPEETELSSSASEVFQSAQPLPNQFRPEIVVSDSSEGEQSDEPSASGKPPTIALAGDVKESSRGKQAGNSQATTEGGSGVSDDDVSDHTPSPTRPNKYRGPASTWRNWTVSERELAASLVQLTAKDLSVHLYNAFKLKKRSSIQDRQYQPEDSDEHAIDDTTHWVLPKVWTAWPLPPDKVPREDDGKRWEEEGSLRRQPYVKQLNRSENLRELLVAQILRLARERLLSRDPEDPESNPTTTKVQQESFIQQPAKAPTSLEQGQRSKKFKPEIMADDELASQILRPTVQHVLSKLDCLLMGLHHARSSYFSVDDAASDSQSQATEQSTSQGRPRKRKRSTSNPGLKTAKASKATASPDVEDASEGRNVSKSKSRRRQSRAQSTHSRRLRLGLRDWSDVLGVASMTGWSSDVVERTAARCASLFGEGITFRTLEEGTLSFTEHSLTPGGQQPTIEKDSELTAEKALGRIGEGQQEMFGGVHTDGFLAPIEGKKSWKYSKRSKRRRESQRSKGQVSSDSTASSIT